MDHDDRTFSMTFDLIAYKATTRELWQSAAEAWHRWGPTFGSWLGTTELCWRLLYPAASDAILAQGRGSTARAARRVGPTFSCLPRTRPPHPRP